MVTFATTTDVFDLISCICRGVNKGLEYTVANGYEYVALINNDATPERLWLSELMNVMKEDVGIVTGKLLAKDNTIDSTGEQYSSWGLAFPRGRNEPNKSQYDKDELVFAATGGASLYRVSMLNEIGFFDEDFFAYYEDVDLSFRAQLAGWKVIYNPRAVAHHKIGASSSKIPGFITFMTIKNTPWLLWKNVPWKLIPTILPRFIIAYTSIVVSSLAKGKVIPVIKGLFVATALLPKKLIQRHKIQSKRKVPVDYIKSIITYDLPPNATKLRKLRELFRTPG